MSESRPEAGSARGDAEVIIAPDGSVMVFDLDARLLPMIEALSPDDPRTRAARAALELGRKSSSSDTESTPQ